LRRFLEQQLFARSRRIKLQTCGMRLSELLQEGEKQVSRRLDQADGAIEALETLASKTKAELASDFLDREQGHLRADLEGVYRHGAEEVLDFVRPRRWVFGEHRATRADRDFLLDLLLEGLHGMTMCSFSRLSDHLSRIGKIVDLGAREALPVGSAQLEPWLTALEQLLQERLALLREQVYTRYNAFARGALRGGCVDRFFESSLPTLKLERQQIEKALMAEVVDLDEELLEPLSRWYHEVSSRLLSQIHVLQQEVALNRLEWDQRLLAPILRFSRLLHDMRIAEEKADDPRH
jgi:hypothetical protein